MMRAHRQGRAEMTSHAKPRFDVLRHCAGAAVTAAVLFGTASRASAHGGIPRAYSILFEPGGGDMVLLRSDLWGFYISKDGGDAFSWVCAEAYSGSSLSTERRSFAVTASGDIYVAEVFDGLRVARAGDVCNFTGIPDFESEVVQDVGIGGPAAGVRVLTASGTADGIVGFVWESTDAGNTWAKVGSQLPVDFSGSSLAHAPSDPDRIYVAGKTLEDTDNGTVYRSTDGGATWDGFDIQVGMSAWVSRIAAVDPADPDVVYFWMDSNEGGGGDIQADQLWLSKDAGETWNKVFQGAGNLPGFALSPDGSTVAVAGPQDGIWQASKADLLAQGSAALLQVFEGKIWGLNWTEEGFYAGTDDFAAEERFTFGVSLDQGASFEPLLEICDATLVACPSDSPTGRLCTEVLTQPGGYNTDYLEGPRCDPALASTGGAAGSGAGGAGAGSAGMAGAGVGGVTTASGGGGTVAAGGATTTAGAGPVPAQSSDGGGCSVSPGRRAIATPAGGLFGLLVAVGRMRRRRMTRAAAS